MTDERLEELQAELPDLIAEVERALAELRNAETCETSADFQSSIADAVTYLRSALKDTTLHDLTKGLRPRSARPVSRNSCEQDPP